MLFAVGLAGVYEWRDMQKYPKTILRETSKPEYIYNTSHMCNLMVIELSAEYRVFRRPRTLSPGKFLSAISKLSTCP